MIKHPIVSNDDSFLITPSLLNSWSNIWNCVDYVREAASDEICIEDKQSLAREKAYAEFLDVLNRLPIEPNEYMLKGIQFEEECYKGNTPVSPIIKDGAFQIVGKKIIKIDDLNILLYGRLDVLKGGVIYDIKRTMRYAPQKYIKSHQHPVYLELFPEAKKFVYLAFDDNSTLHTETYFRDECEDVTGVIRDFLGWLESNNLLEIYLEKWKSLK